MINKKAAPISRIETLRDDEARRENKIMQKEKDVIKQRITFAIPRDLLSGNCSCRCETAAPRTLRAAKHSGERNRLGFTLIELLVVVLIIGILAAVAVPQYQMAVKKSRVMKLLSMTKSIVAAEESYYLANGQYTKDWDELAISIPGTRSHHMISSSDGWQISLTTEGGGNVNGVEIRDEKLPEIKIMAYYEHNPSPHLFYGFLCAAPADNNSSLNVCKSATNKNYAYGTGPVERPHTVYRF